MRRNFSDNTVIYKSKLVQLTTNKWLYVIIIALAYMVWWQWIHCFPLELTSDDALNFSRGVERFSVLEFRPHFPGYPAFIGFSRLAAIWTDSAVASIWVSLLAAMFTPLLIARLVYLFSHSWPAATLGCLLALMQPLLASIALSGLSDSAAIMLFMLALIAAIQQRNMMVGVWIGLMLATRPSYFPLALGLALLPWWGNYTGSKIRAYLQASIAIAVIGVMSLIFIWFHDGSAYFEEGIRFTQGHFSIWGNTVEGDSARLWQWLVALSVAFGWLGFGCVAISLLGAVLSLFIVDKSRTILVRELAATAGVTWLYWIWITVGQNPDNLRHWAPVLFLFLVVFPVQLAWLQQTTETGSQGMKAWGSVFSASAILYCMVIGYQNVHAAPLKAPIQQAITWFKTNPQAKVIGTNYSVNLLRDQLVSRSVYDMYYPSSQLALVEANQRQPESAWRLSGTLLPKQQIIAQFNPRFMGERRLFLYQISQ